MLLDSARRADVVEVCLDHPRRGARAVRRYERELRQGIRRFSWFIYRFRSATFRRLFTSPSSPPWIEEAVTTMLSGDVFRRTPTVLGLAGFKLVYYLASLCDFLRGVLGKRPRPGVADRCAPATD